MRLLILSNVIHYRHQGRLYAYGAYSREIDIWADLFPEVLIAAPCRDREPTGLAVPFTRPNVAIVPQMEAGGDTVRAKIGLLLALPIMVFQLCRAMLRADAIHVRCPGSFGLIGILLAPLFSRYVVAKYAGQWNGYPGEPWTVRLQRRLLRSRWWSGPVTVYGRWPSQESHVVSFFTSVLTEEQLARARRAAGRKRFHPPLRTLFIGRLSAAKNVDVLLRAVARGRAEGLDLLCTVVGEGTQRDRLEQLSRDLGIAAHVSFPGGVGFDHVLQFYEESDVLVLASETEGWPKAIAEAMAFGLIPVGSDRGLVPEMVGEGRGFVVPPRDLDALVNVLHRIAGDPGALLEMSARAAAWGQRYSLESLREALRDLLARSWNVPIHPLRRPAGMRGEQAQP